METVEVFGHEEVRTWTACSEERSDDLFQRQDFIKIKLIFTHRLVVKCLAALLVRTENWK